jgi:hypothetical protein
VNGAKYAGVSTATLTVNNTQLADSGVTYSVAVTNASGGVVPAATLTVVPPFKFTSVALVGTNVVLTFTTSDLNATTSSFTIIGAPIVQGVVQGPFVPVPATITGVNPTFQATVIHSNLPTVAEFFRIQHN